ncbi:hypothetical protein [Lewinella sp. IMCC34183]|uniref:hypothetical protein n=1 Tax=Lewinella sp. IMCC34183 TaxID=2248762 RepID=UPI000E21D6F8|nr:hypothetical protein [Lewinella sp. IMCC34183]
MSPFRLILYVVTVLSGSALPAQIEYNPYGGLLTGTERLTFVSPVDAVEVYESSDWVGGVDLLFGSGQWAPLAGVLYRAGSYDGPAGDGLAYHRLYVPLGVAYRLLTPDFDINLVPHVAIAPGLVLGDDTNLSTDPDLHWNGRAGVRLYLDFVSLGVDYLRAFTTHFPDGSGEKPGRLVLSLGLRW